MGDSPVGFGRYTLVERLAVGGMAELFVATSPGEHGFQKKVVIKRLLPHLVPDPTYNAMFIDEAKLTARLVHPKIAQTFELGRVDEALFIAMEYVEGIDVLAVLREYAACKRRVEPQLAAWIAHEVLDALDYAHHLTSEDGQAMGIVHRDISPSNVLLSTRGDVKLVDFGIARAIDPERAHKSKTGTLKGKYGYMSPEQVLEQPLDARSDLFSVGVVLAEMLTGRRLFAAANELDVLLMVRDAKLTRFDKYGEDVEFELAAVVRKALTKPLDERWQSAAEFRDALAEWMFDHRYRVAPKQVADMVAELHPLIVERRAYPDAASVEGSEGGRAPAEDGAPEPILDGADSMPVMSVSYEPEAPAPVVVARAISASDLAAAADIALRRAETVSARPRAVQVPPLAPAVAIPPVPPPAELPRLGGAARFDDGVIQVPVADTISRAVSAFTLPHSFDELTEEPPGARSRDIQLPTPEEMAHARPPIPPALADIAEPPDDAGDFAVTSPLRVLFRLLTARATGLLVVAVGGIKKDLYVRDGQPEYVSSNVASELFGNYLVSKGVLSDGELAMALAMMPHYGGKLGDTLVGLGLLKPLEVFRHLTRQVRSKIVDVCTWTKGSFGWYAGRENTREAFPLDFNAFEILGAGAMLLSDEQVDTWITRNATLQLRAARTRRVGPERFEVHGLVAMFDLLDGKRMVADLVETQRDRLERLRIGRMLCLLEACDLARPA